MNWEKDGRTKKLPKIIDKPACRKSLFDTLRAVFRTSKSSENLLIEREGDFLPPSHFPRCSIEKVFFMNSVFPLSRIPLL